MASPITWNWQEPYQYLDITSLHYQRQVDLYLNPENDCRRILGLPLAISLTMTTIVAAISMIVEPILKGLGNIIGSHYSKDCSFTRGLGQLLLPIASIIGIAILSPLFGSLIVIGLITTPIFAAFIPDHVHNDLPELLTFKVNYPT